MGTVNNLDLFLIRHGITDWNQEKRYLGHTDQGILISELGQLTTLKEELAKQSFDHVYTSDLRRCQETLDYLEIPGRFFFDDRLREINFGDWEGKTYNQLKNVKDYQAWLTNWEGNPIPNGESAMAFKARIDSFMNDLFQQVHKSNTNRIVMVTHGGVIRYLISIYHSSNSFWDVTVPHGQGIRLSFVSQRGEWVCNSLSVVPSQENEK